MNDLQIQYKQDTGKSSHIVVESEHLTKSLKGVQFDGMTSREIISALEYDFKRNASWGVFIKDLPSEFISPGNDLIAYSFEYVQWLEDKIKELSK
jgi:hypothetical protein